MAFMAYKCAQCGGVIYSFESEFNKLQIRCLKTCQGDYIKQPPNPTVIHQTECYMAEPVLDSMDTNIELDRIMTREARHLKQDKQVDEARRNR
jgi:DNA-directed RNA polymerase subunit RPC12/RpoP